MDFCVTDIETVARESYSKSQPRFELSFFGNEMCVRAAHKRPSGFRGSESTHEDGRICNPRQQMPPCRSERKSEEKVRDGTRDAAEEVEVDHHDGWTRISSLGNVWEMYQNPVNGTLWYCRDTASCFVEAEPAPWEKYFGISQWGWSNERTGEHIRVM